LGYCEYSEERIEIERATEEVRSREMQMEQREREVKKQEQKLQRIDF